MINYRIYGFLFKFEKDYLAEIDKIDINSEIYKLFKVLSEHKILYFDYHSSTINNSKYGRYHDVTINNFNKFHHRPLINHFINFIINGKRIRRKNND